jgi:biopolymer transport protein TolR
MQKSFILTRRRRKVVMSAINVTPLVDVMLVLLIIFMITSPMIVAGINVDLPSSQGKVISGSDEPISVTINKLGQIYINDTQIQSNNLGKKLEAISKANYKLRIFVRSDKTVSYGQVIQVMELINKAGFSKVSLVTNMD